MKNNVTDLFLKNESSDKTYTVFIEGLDVNYVYGPREGKKTHLFQTADDKVEAAKLASDTVAGLMKKGYQLVKGSVAPKTPTDIAEFRRAAALKAWETMRANGTKPQPRKQRKPCALRRKQPRRRKVVEVQTYSGIAHAVPLSHWKGNGMQTGRGKPARFLLQNISLTAAQG